MLSCAVPAVVQSFFIRDISELSTSQLQSLINYTELFITAPVLAYPLKKIRQWIEEYEMDSVTIQQESNKVCVSGMVHV